MLMKGKPETSWRMREKTASADPEVLALRAFGCIAADPDRLQRFLALTGLQPETIRGAAARPDFLAALLDYVVCDEPLLVAIAGEIGVRPEEIAAAQRRLAGPAPDEFG